MSRIRTQLRSIVALALLASTAGLAGCSSALVVKSDPIGAEVYAELPGGGGRKLLGKTPLRIETPELRAILGQPDTTRAYCTLSIESPERAPERLAVPLARFGTRLIEIDANLKSGANEPSLASEILQSLFLAQKFAQSRQFERAQQELDRILAKSPKFARALSMRGTVFYLQRNLAESLRWYELALQADPQMEDAVKMIARIRSERSGGGRVPASSSGGSQ